MAAIVAISEVTRTAVDCPGPPGVEASTPWQQHRPTEIDFSYVADVAPSSDETLLWSDPGSSLTVSTAGAGDGSRYRLRPGSWMYVDIIDERSIVARARTGVAKDNCDHFLGDQVIPRMVANSGKLVLHAGGVRVEDFAILLIGPSGRGKSTLSASFDGGGTALMGDDAIIIDWVDDSPRAEAVYPSLRLLPDSIAALLPKGTAAALVADYSDKQRITLGAPESISLPLRAAFILSPPDGESTITIRPMSIADACMAFVDSSFALDPSDIPVARTRLADASDLARQLPTFSLSYPRDYARLPEVRHAILGQIAALDGR